MTRQTLALTDALHAYVVANGSEPDDLVRDLIAETAAALPHDAGMQVAPEQAALLTLLTRITGVRRALEIGTFTGLSSIAIARGLADGGRLICSRRVGGVHVDGPPVLAARPASTTASSCGSARPRRPSRAARRAAPRSGLHRRGQDRLPRVLGGVVPRMRPGGLILVDNVLRHGQVLDPDRRDEGPSRWSGSTASYWPTTGSSR